MNMAKDRKIIYRVVIVLCMIFATIQITACKGDTSAPLESTITLETFGSPVITNLSVTAEARKTQSYRVSVADGTGAPLNGIDVDFLGQFTAGDNMLFGGVTGTAPVTLSVTKTTDDFGFINFQISVPYYTYRQLHIPYNQSAIGSTTGGQLRDDTYRYTITALDAIGGETNASASVAALVSGTSVTTPTGSVTLSWAAVPGAASYRIYGNGGDVYGLGPASVGLMVTILNPSGDPITFLDMGTYTPDPFSTPPATNGSGLSLNSVKGSVIATSGSVISDTLGINF
jgi:hypothetical protein